MYCEKCGSLLNDDAKFCRSCGAPTATSVDAEQNEGIDNAENVPTQTVDTAQRNTQTAAMESLSGMYNATSTSIKNMGLSSVGNNQRNDIYEKVPHIYQDLGGWLKAIVVMGYIGIVAMILECVLLDIQLIQNMTLISQFGGSTGILSLTTILVNIAYIVAAVIEWKFIKKIKEKDSSFLWYYHKFCIFGIAAIFIINLLSTGFASAIGGAIGIAIPEFLWTLYFVKSVRVRTYMGSDDYLREDPLTRNVTSPIPADIVIKSNQEHTSASETEPNNDIVCQNCGNKITEGKKACKFCGTPIVSGNNFITEEKDSNRRETQNSYSRKETDNPIMRTAVALPIMLLLFVLLVIPFFWSLFASFKNYSTMHGIFASPFVGLKNYADFVKNPQFLKIFGNSMRIGLISIVCGSVFVFVVTYGIAAIKNKILKAGALALLMLPALMPVSILVNKIIPVSLLTNVKWYSVLPVLYEIVCVAPLAVLAGSFACKRSANNRTVLFVTICYVAIRALTLFSTNSGFIYLTSNPTTYEVSDVFSAYATRAGFMMGDWSLASASYVFSSILQLLPSILGFVLLFWVSNKFCENNTGNKLRNTHTILSIPALVLSVITLVIFIIVVKNSFGRAFYQELISNVRLSFIYAGVLSVAMLIGGLMLSYMMTSLTTGVRGIGLAIGTLFMLVMENYLGQFMILRTILPRGELISSLLVSLKYIVYFAFGLFIAFGGKTPTNLSSFLRQAVAPGIALLGISFARFWGTLYLEPMIFINNRESMPISLILRQLFMESNGMQPNVVLFIAIPALIGLVGILCGALLDNSEE